MWHYRERDRELGSHYIISLQARDHNSPVNAKQWRSTLAPNLHHALTRWPPESSPKPCPPGNLFGSVMKYAALFCFLRAGSRPDSAIPK